MLEALVVQWHCESPLGHSWRVLTSPRLRGPRAKGLGLAGLVAIRLYRAYRMLALLFESLRVDPRKAVLAAALLGSALATDAAPAETIYKNGFPADPGFFPIGVWLQSSRNAAEYRAIGVNTFIGTSDGATRPAVEALAKSGLFAAVGQDEAALGAADGVVRAWLQADEPDNAQPIAPGRYGPCIPAAEVAKRTAQLSARDPTRPVMINFGRGVADPEWAGRGSCTGDLRYYDTAIAGAGILSFDIYPVGSDTERVKGKLQYVARGVRQLVRRRKQGQQVWAILETTALDPQRPVKPEELRAEIWMALTAGANGIVYFVHEWAGGLREDGIFRHPDIVAEAGRIDARIAALAPALNSPSLEGKVAVSSPVPIATMAKRRGRALYLFAVVLRNRAAAASFAVRGLGEAEAEVLGEGRRLKIGGGFFDDRFPGYGVHLYRIGLPEDAH